MTISIQTNTERQNNVREIFNGFRFNQDVTDRVAVLNQPQAYSLKDLNFYSELYKGFKERPNKSYPLGLTTELEELKAERDTLKESNRSMDPKKVLRMVQLTGNLESLERVLGVLEGAIAERLLARAQRRLQNTLEAKKASGWSKDRSINKAQAAEFLGGDEAKLKRKLEYARNKGGHVIEILSDKERLSFEPCGASIRYIIERKS